MFLAAFNNKHLCSSTIHKHNLKMLSGFDDVVQCMRSFNLWGIGSIPQL